MAVDIQESLAGLKNRIKITGIGEALPSRPELTVLKNQKYKEVKKIYKNTKKEHMMIFVEEFVYRTEIAKILKEDIIWLSKWCFDAEGEESWMEECHKVAWEYLKTGGKHLPHKYRDAQGQGAFFCYDKNASVEGIEMPRGVGKTFTFSALRAVQEFVKKTDGKWLVAHSDKFKAQKNLASIKTTMLNPYLVLIFPEMFHPDLKGFTKAGGQVTTEKINIVFNEIDENGSYKNYRPEATFTVASPQIDRTGYHVDGIFADDLVTDETSRSPEATEKLYQYYRSLWGLRQLGQPFKIFITGTEWWEGSLYNILKNLGSKVTWFQMPAQWTDSKDNDQRLSRHHQDEYLEEQKVQMRQDYEPQMLMQPRLFDEDLNLVDDEKSFTFRWVNEQDAPLEIVPVMFDKERLKQAGCIVSSLDPSYSSKGKVENSDCSKATLITGVIASDYKGDKVLYIYDAWQKMGWDLSSGKEEDQALNQMFNVYASNIKNEDVDWTVCDSQGTQKATIQDYFFRLKKHVKRELQCSYHEKGSLMSTKGKKERATFVLQEKFVNGQVKVHWRLKEVIDQIMRRSSGYDILDVLIQLCLPMNIDWEIAHSMFSNKNRNNLYDMRKKKKRKPMSKIANY